MIIIYDDSYNNSYDDNNSYDCTNSWGQMVISYGFLGAPYLGAPSLQYHLI